MKTQLKIVGTFVLLVLATSCGIVRPYQRPDDLQKDGLYRGSASSDTTSIADLPWQSLFNDPVLQSLIQTGLNRNYDLKIAVARINSATANLAQSRAAFLPAFSVDGQVTRSKTSSAQLRSYNIGNDSTGSKSSVATNANTLYSLTGSASWEADVWGKLRSTKQAYVAAYLQSDAYRREVETQLVAGIATDYYQLLAYDEQIRIVTQTVANRRKDVDVVKDLLEGGIVTGADVVNAQANLHAAELDLPDLMQNRRELENTMSLLLAMPSDSIRRTTFAAQSIDTSLQTGVSSQLLANRPDVQEAEYAFQHAFELTNVARTYFYPSLTISGTAGWATANTLQSFFTGTLYGNVLGGLTQPIFNRGLNKQRLRTAEAARQEAYYLFQSALLGAGREVSNALYAYQKGVEKETLRKEQINSLRTAVDYTEELLKYTSATNYTDVLTAQQNLLSAQLNSVSDKLQQLQAVVELYRALGGGWK
ncbi:MAG: efflux transporter outer membrane subunit [Williamsia sp.]|nr:efflux transporter outer membrane subunit [Williamsia sp.]